MKQALLDKIYEIADRVARPLGLEIVEVELLGGGAARLLRLSIDKEGGVSHADCEVISREVGAQLDAEDVIPGEAGYQLEVSSPGVERRLSRPRDFERFTGQKVKISLREPVEGAKRYEGSLASFVDGTVTLDVEGKTVAIPFDLISKANLKFEW
jgi:ribosome maturation factor RimP